MKFHLLGGLLSTFALICTLLYPELKKTIVDNPRVEKHEFFSNTESSAGEPGPSVRLGERAQASSLVCGVTASAGNDLGVCAPGGSVQLSGFFGGQAIDFYWEPANLLNDPNVNEPVTTFLNQTTTFTFNVVGTDPDAPNLVQNGSFDQGNVGFSSNYTFFPDGPGNTPWMNEARYSIVSNPNDIHGNFANCNDQDGTNSMMVVNAASTVEEIWCQTILVNQQTDYNFSAWVATVVEEAPALLQFTVNGFTLGDPFGATNINCDWNEFTATWNSGNTVLAELCILNLNTALSGNDFAIDNIGFFESCTSSDEVTVNIIDLELDINSLPTIDCNAPGGCVDIDVSLQGTGDLDEYQWFPTLPGQTVLNDETATPTLCGAGPYNLIASRRIGLTECTEFFQITIDDNNALPPTPTISGPNELCPGETTFSVTANTAYANYDWDLPAGAVLLSPENSNMILVDVANATENTICLGVTNFCGNTSGDCFAFTLLPADTITRDSMVCQIIGPGSLIDTIVTPGSCDTIIITQLNLMSADTIFQFENSCSPADTGTVQSILQGQGMDCDTVLLTTTTLLPSDTIFVTESSCSPQDTGFFETVLPGQGLDCDTTVFTTVTLSPADTVFVTDASCSPQDTGVFIMNIDGGLDCDTVRITTVELIPLDTVFRMDASCMPSDTGIFQTVIPHPEGCDTIVFTQVELIPLDTVFRMDASCMPSDTGLFQTVIPHPDGCDTIVFTQVELIPLDTIFRMDASCMPSDTGLFQTVIPHPEGCDTIVFTQVELIPLDTVFRMDASCMPSDTGLFQTVIPHPDGCDTIVFTQVELIPLDTIFRMDASCMPSDTGLFQSVIPHPEGCDTIVFTQVELIPLDTVFRMDASCMPSDTGLFQTVIPHPEGCDTIVFTQVDLIPLDTVFRMDASCMPSDTGLFQTVIPHPEGCDTIVFTQVNLIPLDTIFRMDASCMPSDTGLFQTVIPHPDGCDTIVFTQVELIPLDTIFRMDASCMPSDTGLFQTVIPHPEGCDTIVFTQVDLIPLDTIFRMDASCIPSDTGLFQSVIPHPEGCDTIVFTQVELIPLDTVFQMDASCMPSDTGLFQTVIPHPEGCDTIVFTQVELIPLDTVFRMDASCMPSDTGLFQTVIPHPEGCDTIVFTQVEYIVPDTIFAQATSCDPNDAGLSSNTVIDADGCVTTTLTNTTLIDQAFTFNRVFTCDLDAVGFDTVLFQTVACDSLVVTETYANLPIIFETRGVAEICDFPGSGAAIAFDVGGGSGIYTYTLDQEREQADGIFNGVNPGLHEIVVTDSEGCSASREVTVAPGPEYVLDLGPDQTIRWGDSLLVQLQTNISLDSSTAIIWSDTACQGCVSRWLKPLETTSYSVVVIDSFGCRAEANLMIIVERPDGIYVPNVFTPNGDGVNDFFQVFGDETYVTHISNFAVYSRWGESVFRIEETRVNTNAGGWNGIFREQPMDTGVFIYHFTAHYVDGSMREFKGDVLLTR